MPIVQSVHFVQRAIALDPNALPRQNVRRVIIVQRQRSVPLESGAQVMVGTRIVHVVNSVRVEALAHGAMPALVAMDVRQAHTALKHKSVLLARVVQSQEDVPKDLALAWAARRANGVLTVKNALPDTTVLSKLVVYGGSAQQDLRVVQVITARLQ